MTMLYVLAALCGGLRSADAQSEVPAPSASVAPSQEVQHGVVIVRHGSVEPQRIEPTPLPPAPRVSPAEAALAELADLGLIHIRPIQPEAGPLWKYKPKEYYGYHPKPDWNYHPHEGWRYSGPDGWRLRPEPAWSLRPGAVDTLLEQLPTHGRNWYVARWQ